MLEDSPPVTLGRNAGFLVILHLTVCTSVETGDDGDPGPAPPSHLAEKPTPELEC